MEIMRIKVSAIHVAAYNPRRDLQPGDVEYEKLRESIETFGYIDPLIWNKQTGNLVGGHQRLKILKGQGLEEVDVSVVDLPLDKEKLLNIALNRIQGEWDEDKLAALLEELGNVDMPDFDIKLTGFDMPEISEILDRTSNPKEDNFDFDGEVEKIIEPITKRGDVVRLGEHVLMCGDSADPEDLKRLMGTDLASLLFTDPPYGIAYDQNSRPNGNHGAKKHSAGQKILHDDLSEEDYAKWIKTIFENMGAFLAPGAPIYIFNAHKQFAAMHAILTELGYYVSCVITWAKERFAISFGDYHQQTEFLMYGWKAENGPHKWYGPTNESTLWEISRDPTSTLQHVTQKPVALSARAIRNSSQRGDCVLELFGGSGSTLIGCEALGRRCRCMELSPAYCDGIVRRYISYIGKDKAPKDLVERYIKEEAHANQ